MIDVITMDEYFTGGIAHPVKVAGGNGQPNPVRPRLRPAADRNVDAWTPRAPDGRAWQSAQHGNGRPSLLGDLTMLIVDDCRLYREYLATALAAHGAVAPSLAWDQPSLAAALEENLPRVVLFNVSTGDSTTLLRHIMKIRPRVQVIVLGVSEDDESEIVTLAEAGVAGYLLRSESLDDLFVLIRKVAAGEFSCSPRVSAILLRRVSALASQPRPAARDLALTAREAQILRMLELGLSNRDIAAELCIAVHTVKNHVHSLLTKLGVGTRAQAAALSHRLRYSEADL